MPVIYAGQPHLNLESPFFLLGAGNPYDASDLEVLYVADAALDDPA